MLYSGFLLRQIQTVCCRKQNESQVPKVTVERIMYTISSLFGLSAKIILASRLYLETCLGHASADLLRLGPRLSFMFIYETIPGISVGRDQFNFHSHHVSLQSLKLAMKTERQR